MSIPGKILSRVLLDRIRDTVDPKLREEQAGFRKGISYPDKITTLRIIMEQSVEWKLNFVDYEKLLTAWIEEHCGN